VVSQIFEKVITGKINNKTTNLLKTQSTSSVTKFSNLTMMNINIL